MAKGKHDGLEALRDALIVRKKITEVLKVLALQSQKRIGRLEESLRNATAKAESLELAGINDPEIYEEIEKLKEALREERFNHWLIKEECRTVAVKAADLTGSLRTANTIFPDVKSPHATAEVTERRIWLDRALGACNVLQDELQYIAESVYADKNKFTPLCLEIETLFRKIKGIRQADNRFLKQGS